MDKILIFAGTSDGRKLAGLLHSHQIPVHICVATEYGEKVMQSELKDCVTVGRLDAAQMVDLMKREWATKVVDATHPYAVAVSANIRSACREAGLPYLRLLRDEDEELAEEEDAVIVGSVEEAAEYLKGVPGRALIATGSKELAKFTVVPDYAERFTARVLSTPEVLEACRRIGFEGKNLIAMQGPFTEELNTAMLKQTHSEWLVTKDSGKEGGFPEKVRAAKNAGARLLLIQRPRETEGYTFRELVQELFPELVAESKNIDLIPVEPRKFTLLGIGMGAEEQLTLGGDRACREADVIIGARRMLQSLRRYEKPVHEEYRSAEIIHYIHRHPEYHNVVIALSGDVGFYSGARKLLDELPPDETELICGISSVVYFCSRLQMPWEDVKLVSVHGRYANLVGALQEHKKVFSLVGGAGAMNEVLKQLCLYGFGSIPVHTGENLSYPDERILEGTPETLKEETFGGLTVLIAENPDTDTHVITPGIPDEQFLRDKVPMTKEEVRSLSISKLQLTKDAVVWDIGAGTGSVSVECARLATEGHVYAVEQKEVAAELIEKNARKFGTPNLEVIRGLAPQALEDLPTPTHAFIGGSSGNLGEILDLLRSRNPEVRIVINCIAMETISAMTEYIGKKPFRESDIVQIAAAKSRTLGRYHMMTGMNPIIIASFRGEESRSEEESGSNPET